MKFVTTLLSVFFALTVHGQTIGSQSTFTEIPQYSSIPTQIQDVLSPSLSLNGSWSFYVKERPSSQSAIQVPGEWEMQGFKVDEGETAVFSRPIQIPEDWKNKPVKIRFDGVSSYAVVKINNRKIGVHEGGFTPFEFDITPYLNYKTDSIQVEVSANTISDKLGCISQYAVHTVGGILRKVVAFVCPDQYVQDFNYAVLGKYRPDRATLRITALLNNSTDAGTITIEHNLYWKNNKVKSVRNRIKLSDRQQYNYATDISVKHPKWWNPEQPNLYQLETVIYKDGREAARYSQRMGIRTIEITGAQLLLNGVPIKLKGVNRHSAHPLLGRASNPELDVQDAKLFKEANCNYIRTSHYPPSEEFLNAADEIGLLVESEAAICWIQHGASPIWRWWNYTDEKWLPFLLQANAENVKAGINHPSVILWSLGNESHWSPLWDKVNKMVKQIDPTRPTVFHDQCWGAFNNGGSTADIANYHYPGINGPAATDTMSRPTLFGEYAHLSTYNRLELLADPGIRTTYGPALRQFVDSMYAYPSNLGGAIWSGIDDEFHLPDGRMVGYGPWGPVDGWRRPKPEYWGVKKAYTPVRIAEPDWQEASTGRITVKLENRFLYTSLDKVKFEVRTDGNLIPVKSSILPGKTGEIAIPATANTNSIDIKIYDPSGFLTEWEFFEKPQAYSYDSVHTPLSFTETDASIQVRQGNVYYSISKHKGIMTGAWINDKLVLKEGPVFSVVPANQSYGGKPNVAGETFQNDLHPVKAYAQYPLIADSLSINSDNSGLTIRFFIRYQESEGYQTYHFTKSGFCSTTYSIKYAGKDSIPYQYGMLMKVSTEFDQLAWERKGQFSTYPSDDIGRLKGTTDLGADKIGAVSVHGYAPTPNWKEDPFDWGRRDFRSTKHNILRSSIADKTGNRIEVFSDGSQSSRSWLQDASIHWLIADYWNNGSEPFYGSPFASPRLSIDQKTLTGTIRLSIQ